MKYIFTNTLSIQCVGTLKFNVRHGLCDYVLVGKNVDPRSHTLAIPQTMHQFLSDIVIPDLRPIRTIN